MILGVDWKLLLVTDGDITLLTDAEDEDEHTNETSCDLGTEWVSGFSGIERLTFNSARH